MTIVTHCSVSMDSQTQLLALDTLPQNVGPLLFLLFGNKPTSGVFTAAGFTGTVDWFFYLSSFESVFLVMWIVQITLMYWLGILPISLTELWQNHSGSRRKRRMLKLNPPELMESNVQAIVKLLTLFEKLDNSKCGFRALCELKYRMSNGLYKADKLSKSVERMLLLSPFLKDKRANSVSTKHDSEIETALKPFLDALFTKKSDMHDPVQFYGNQTGLLFENSCHRKYPLCSATADDLMYYVERVNLLEL